MSSESPVSTIVNWHEQALDCWQQGQYGKAAELYGQAIDAEPEVKAHYWHLGLMLLLQGAEAEAQTTWLMALAEGESEAIDQWAAELMQVLETEADRQQALSNQQLAWVIRQHLREIFPENLTNLLYLIQLSAALEQLTGDEIRAWNVIPVLEAFQGVVPVTLLSKTLEVVLNRLPPDRITVEFAAACFQHLSATDALLQLLIAAGMKIAYSLCYPLLAAHLFEEYRKLDPDNLEVLWNLSVFYQKAQEYDLAIAAAQSHLALAEQTIEKTFSNILLLRALVSAGGRWEESVAAIADHRQLLATLCAEQPVDLRSGYAVRLFNSPFYLPYFSDDLRQNRTIQNQVMQFCQRNVEQYASQRIARYRQSRATSAKVTTSDRRLKVGYVSHCMLQHSVGWLARWLLQHHDRDQVELHGYFIINRPGDYLNDWYLSQMEHTCRMGIDCLDNPHDLADRIYADDLDILIDLDSLTLDVTCEIMALKPAPVQATWLGWDAAGISTIDYFIADPYVLPDWAQEYYPETIWRLPNTYIAVDGFEVEVPTLRRDDLGVPADAIVYLSSQSGRKRHRDTVRLQMQILKQVPNSYFFIKGFADEKSIQEFFTHIAEEEGVNPDRLRFLPNTAREAEHRANLAIADVVLDTYPYNGATTTLETLWMGIPLVTRVGEQFAARNSYTMLMNVGVKAGIAWTDAEYVEWGVRLGTDATLRQQIHWQLLQSRRTAPLWNAKQFTREMEQAYKEMCQRSKK
ncbi:O-linked N-acetylglucosamine transferase, SPINDLY family protein [Leptodesmis sp.]|uniref:O-linked N-acetylglucosamine transferase, SPINDLY family protein n=1 Tax=Leptodesmis sp. TaxID=3100501 RepID=UPI00405353CD